jgi:hypothetical protein
MKTPIFLLLLALGFLFACGEGIVTVDESNYEAKIVIQGYLYPNKKVSGIRIMRNIPVKTDIFRNDLIIWNADVSLTDISNNNENYQLTFNPESLFYQYNGSDLNIDYGGQYRLDVAATIDDKLLRTNSVTAVPLQGFGIIDSLSSDSLFFNKRGNNGDLIKAKLVFSRSAKTEFYAFSFVALDATTSSFIYDHPFVYNFDENDVRENFDDLRFSHDTIFNTSETSGTTVLTIENYHTLFYGWYRVIAYAGDKNFKDYYLTHANVQEMDGNLHEPKFHFEGDGIGVFGSAIVDTLYFKILQD